MKGEIGMGVLLSTLLVAYAVAYVVPSLEQAGQNLSGVNAALFGLIPFTLIIGTVYGVAKGLGVI